MSKWSASFTDAWDDWRHWTRFISSNGIKTNYQCRPPCTTDWVAASKQKQRFSKTSIRNESVCSSKFLYHWHQHRLVYCSEDGVAKSSTLPVTRVWIIQVTRKKPTKRQECLHSARIAQQRHKTLTMALHKWHSFIRLIQKVNVCTVETRIMTGPVQWLARSNDQPLITAIFVTVPNCFFYCILVGKKRRKKKRRS